MASGAEIGCGSPKLAPDCRLAPVTVPPPEVQIATAVFCASTTTCANVPSTPGFDTGSAVAGNVPAALDCLDCTISFGAASVRCQTAVTRPTGSIATSAKLAVPPVRERSTSGAVARLPPAVRTRARAMPSEPAQAAAAAPASLIATCGWKAPESVAPSGTIGPNPAPGARTRAWATDAVSRHATIAWPLGLTARVALKLPVPVDISVPGAENAPPGGRRERTRPSGSV